MTPSEVTQFIKQREVFKKFATQEISDKMELVKTTLKEIAAIADAAGIPFQLGGCDGELTSMIHEIDSNSPHWNSSSYDC